jgi:hypothetical protein
MISRILHLDRAQGSERNHLEALTPWLEEHDLWIRVTQSRYIVLDETSHTRWEVPRDLQGLSIHLLRVFLEELGQNKDKALGYTE